MLLLLQRIFSEVPVLVLLYLTVDHLHGCFSYSRGLFQQIQDSAYNLTFRFSFIVVFGRSTIKTLVGPALSVGPFQKVQHEALYYVVRKNEKLL